MVGAAGLEPAASWSQTRRASQLRYAPTIQITYSLPPQADALANYATPRLDERIVR